MSHSPIDSDLSSKSGTISISSVSLLQHTYCYLKMTWKTIFFTSAAVLTSVWTFIGILVYNFDLDLAGKRIFFSLFLFSITVGIIKSIISYLNTIPKGLEDQPKYIQKIGHFRKLYWEFKLAYYLLKQKLQKTDQKYTAMKNDLTFIKSQYMSIEEYLQWLQNRPTNVINMINVAKKLIVEEFYTCTAKSKGEEVKIGELIRVTDLIQNLYNDAYNFELEGKSIHVHPEFLKVHLMQSEWTDIIRDAVHQFVEKLELVSKRTKKDKGPINVEVIFKSPSNIDEYLTEIENIEQNLPDLIAAQYS